jgi:hypothetical protein
MKHASFFGVEDGHNVLTYRLVERNGFLMEGLELSAVLWLDHVAQTHEPQSDRMLQGCIIHPLRVVDDGCRDTGEYDQVQK